jgi:hypothetical protein
VVDTSTRPAHSSRTENRTNELRHIRIGKGSKKGDTGIPRNNSLKSAGALSLSLPCDSPLSVRLSPSEAGHFPRLRDTLTQRERETQSTRDTRAKERRVTRPRDTVTKPVYRHKTPSYASAFAIRLPTNRKRKKFLTGFRRNFCI